MPGRPRPRHPGVPGQRRDADAVHRIPGRGAMTGSRSPGGPRRPPPEGYLGAAARITSGPAPELVAAGYALEIADAPLLHRGLTLADLAHLVGLVECGTLRRDEAAPLCAVLLDLLDSAAADFPYNPVYGDAYNSRERELERALGPVAGRLHIGRTRREAGRIAFRLALRDKLLSLHADVAAFAAGLSDLAAKHAATLWADSTYLQPAEPSTFGHYLGGFAEQAVRHLDRIEAAYRGADASPAGAGAAGGPRLPLDRARLAALLGFGSVGPHTRDAMWSVDALARPGGRGRPDRGDPRPAGRGPGDLRQSRVRLRDARRLALPGQRAHAAKAQPVRPSGAARRGGHADGPACRAARHGPHPVRTYRQLAVRLRRGGRGARPGRPARPAGVGRGGGAEPGYRRPLGAGGQPFPGGGRPGGGAVAALPARLPAAL